MRAILFLNSRFWAHYLQTNRSRSLIGFVFFGGGSVQANRVPLRTYHGFSFPGTLSEWRHKTPLNTDPSPIRIPLRSLITSCTLWIHSHQQQSLQAVRTKLVGGWGTRFQKYYIVQLDHLPKDRGKNKHTSDHHLANCDWLLVCSSRKVDKTHAKKKRIQLNNCSLAFFCWTTTT